jgi:hypothetical protein
VQEEIAVIQEEVSLKRADHFLKAALPEDELFQLLVCPLVGPLDGFGESETSSLLTGGLEFAGKGTDCVSVAGAEDVDVLASDEDGLRVPFEHGGHHFRPEEELLLPVVPLTAALVVAHHELPVAVVQLALVDPPRQHAQVVPGQLGGEVLVDQQHVAVGRVRQQSQQAAEQLASAQCAGRSHQFPQRPEHLERVLHFDPHRLQAHPALTLLLVQLRHLLVVLVDHLLESVAQRLGEQALAVLLLAHEPHQPLVMGGQLEDAVGELGKGGAAAGGLEVRLDHVEGRPRSLADVGALEAQHNVEQVFDQQHLLHFGRVGAQGASGGSGVGAVGPEELAEGGLLEDPAGEGDGGGGVDVPDGALLVHFGQRGAGEGLCMQGEVGAVDRLEDEGVVDGEVAAGGGHELLLEGGVGDGPECGLQQHLVALFVRCFLVEFNLVSGCAGQVEVGVLLLILLRSRVVHQQHSAPLGYETVVLAVLRNYLEFQCLVHLTHVL